jgi:putative membrane protein
MNIKDRFSAEDLERIRAAVREAESKISGEVVPVFVEKSGHYMIANYRAAVLAATFVFLLIVLFDRYVPSLSVYDPVLMFTIVVLGGVIGALMAQFIPFVKRLMLNQNHFDAATHQRANAMFLDEEVFNTSQRTGIMIFVSFFEREVIVMADTGISKVVDQKEWDNLVRIIIEHTRKGKITDGIVLAIKRCGEILLEKGFVISPDDVNELKDHLRLEN